MKQGVIIFIGLLLAAASGSAQTISTVYTNTSSMNTVKVDGAGNIYFLDGTLRIRKVDTKGAVTVVAGNGTMGFSGDNGPATSASIGAATPYSGIAIDSAGNVFFTDGENQRIRRVDAATGIIKTVAGGGGNGAPAYAGDNGPATSAQLNYPEGISLDSSGNLYIADWGNIRIRKVDTNGIITTVAGMGAIGFSGDGGPATKAAFNEPVSVVADNAGGFYFTDGLRIRKVDASGNISTVAGNAKVQTGDGGPATAAGVWTALGMALDRSGNLYFAQTSSPSVRRIDAAGIITTVAGTGTAGVTGDGGPATSAMLRTPRDVSFDSTGAMYIDDSGNSRVRKVTASVGLTATPATLSFSYTAGAADPAVQTINIASTGAAASFTTSVSTTSGGNWLRVTPNSGTTPAALSISVSPAGLAGGATYQGSVTLNSATAGVASTSFSVSLAVSGPGAPVFSSASIVNAMGYQNKLAPDTIFVIFGSTMGPDAFTAADGPNFPNSLAGTSISFTPASGGNAIPAKMIYTSAGQIAGLLPSSIAPGTYAVRVIYNSLNSAPQNVTVIPRSVGIATTNNGGTGTAQANDANVNGGVSFVRFTSGSLNYKALDFTLSPAHPGDVLTLWVTGFGADPANDTGGSSGDQTAAGNFVVLLGDRSITPDYSGASPGYPGLGQINFTIPADMALGCFTSLVVSTGGELSNAVTVPIAAVGAGACSDPNLSTASLAKLDAGQGIVISGLGIAQAVSTIYRTSTPGGTPTTTTGTSTTTSAVFPRYNADAYAWLFGYQKVGPCLIYDHTGIGPAASIYLDAGASLPLTGPGLAAGVALSPIPQSQFFSSNGPEYTFVPANGSLTAGTYTISGKGGKDIGPFTVSVQFPSTFAATNLNSLTTIDRTQPLNVTWTGGDQDVDVIISSSKVLGKDASGVNIVHTVSMTCTAPASQGSLSIPVAALSKLLPEGIDTASVATGSGLLSVQAVNTTLFNPPLVSGGTTDFGAFTATSVFGQTVIIQ